jgi:hypothetical protein
MTTQFLDGALLLWLVLEGIADRPFRGISCFLSPQYLRHRPKHDITHVFSLASSEDFPEGVDRGKWRCDRSYNCLPEGLSVDLREQDKRGHAGDLSPLS